MTMKTDKYKVSEELMNYINNWRDEAYKLNDLREGLRFGMHPDVCVWWWGGDTPIERNNRLIALIQGVNGEDVFEDEKLFNVQIIKGNWGRASWLYRDDDDVLTSFSKNNNDLDQLWTLEQIKAYGFDDETVYKRVPVGD